MALYPIPACSEFFGLAPALNFDGCRAALSNIPISDAPILYRPLRRSLSDPRGLLIVETHNTCQLRLHVSGKWVEEHDFAISIVPNRTRDLFTKVIEECEQSQMGGYVADGFQNTIDWIIRKDTEFPGEPPSAPGRPRNLRIPEYATFLTAMVWTPRDPQQFEPGANSPITPTVLQKVLRDAAILSWSKDRDFAAELYHRAEFLWDIREKMWGGEIPYWTWWGDRRRKVRALTENGSLASVNATRLPVLDFTAPAPPPELGWYGGGNCTAVGDGSCSTSRRQRTKKSKNPNLF